MSARAVAGRYARALLDVATRDGNAEQVERDLESIAGLMTQNVELQRALTNPAVPVPSKRAIVKSLVERLAFSSAVSRLLLILAERDRLALIQELLGQYQERVMDLQQVIRAEVTTALPLSDDSSARLRQRLSDATRRPVTITTKVDPSLIAGIVTRIGGTVYDGSVARQLSRVRQRLIGEA